MLEDRDSERLTDVLDAVDDDPLGMKIGPGTEVGGYIIDGELGHGAMGVVYSATHPVIRKRAAIKILRLDVSRSPIAVERFIQEARAVNQIGHPNIIDIFAYGALPDGRAYHVMDLLVGESLRRRLKRSVLHPSEAASVIDEIASALMAAHDNGFVHRDLKPDNVFLVSHEQRWPEVKLLDFGLAKLMPEYGVPAFITKTGVMLGTPEYMSPEQARGLGVDYRTDIYALGIVMFEILAGNRPFPALAEPMAVLLQHAEEPPMSLGDTVAGLPDEMVQLVDAMLAKTPQARPSLAAVRAVIKRLRTTQLPTRSVAGLAMSSLSKPQLGARPDLAISASRVGAEAVLPDPITASIRPPSGLPSELQKLAAAAADHPASAKPDITTRGVGVQSILASQAGVARFRMPTPSPETLRPPPVGSQPLPSRAKTPSGSTHASPPPRTDLPPAAPGFDPLRSSGAGHVPLSPPPASQLAPPASQLAELSQLTPPASQLAAPRTRPTSQRLSPKTTLGVGPAGASVSYAARPARSPRARRWWLAIAALLVVAAAVGLGLTLLSP